MNAPVNMDQIDTIHKAYKALYEVNQAMTQVWVTDSLFAWQWWLQVGLTLVPWTVWLIFRKRDSTDRLLYAGFFAMLVSSWLDFEGVSLGLWSYEYSLIPTMPTFIPWDFSLIPVTIMFLLQVKPNLNPVIKAIFFAGMTCCVGEPIFKWVNVYNPEGWKYIYSFGIYGLIYLATHYVSRRTNFANLAPGYNDEYFGEHTKKQNANDGNH
ncbi:MAG TPA: CBO0543 family protein [Bacillales bacterium]|nr:CBO0543 family protein [Bacillales bacterium]